jgi:dihydroorotate dehydrogenase
MKPFHVIRPLLFKLKPEQAHHLILTLLRLGGSLWPARQLLRAWFGSRTPVQGIQAFGLNFPNPLGLAAGFDKDAEVLRGLGCLGFGHIEVGTVTPLPQPGNLQPRLFRLVEDRAVINRMGFNNLGAQHMAERLQKRRPDGTILGVNIGKNKSTPPEEAVLDYLSLLNTFAPLADYLAVNISSPNTPGLRSLQERKSLECLLIPLAAERTQLAQKLDQRVPLLVKLAPDLSDAGLEDALDVILQTGMDGVIISNTTLSRSGLQSQMATETGGLSGAPLRGINTALVRKTANLLGGRLPIIASGGVFSAADAREKLDAGAVLVQVYTGMIYEGPALARDILNAGLI